MARKGKATAAEYVARLHASCDQYARDNDRCAFSARQVNLWDEIHRDKARDAVLSLLRMWMYGAMVER